MEAYRTWGTLWTIITGPDGKVKYNHSHLEDEKAIGVIEGLKKE